MKFTDAQQKVIDTREHNILVSAAAGSGKTAVLVERIIQRILDRSNPVDIDRMLIVTFTSAAAAEMRERIAKAIADRLVEEPENEHLQRQSALIHHAQITTIHGFCLFLIRNHFDRLDIDPGFRVADETEMQLLSADVMDALLEEEYAGKNQAFLQVVESLSTGKNDAALRENILSLHRFAMSYPWPKKWLMDHEKEYEVESIEDLQQSPILQYALEYAQKVLADCEKLMQKAVILCTEADGPYMYLDSFQGSLDGLQKAVKAQNWVELDGSLAGVGFDRLSSKKDDSVSPEKKVMAKAFRDQVKNNVKKLQEDFFSIGPEGTMEMTRKLLPVIKELNRLTLAYSDRLAEAKKERNIIDFSDMEHMALQILYEGEELSEVAKDYRCFFQEVMCDEYQDSNLVQESILAAVAGEKKRFMVGDVKQSIYRFRLARPELFMEKFRDYAAGDEKSMRIDLDQNFRSRKDVLTAVNVLFDKLMAPDLGGIDYDDAASLKYGGLYETPDQEIQDKPGTYAAEILLLETDQDAEDSADEQEAFLIAQKMHELVAEGFLVVDKETGKKRPVRYGDMVILMRSMSGKDEIYKKVLEESSIPAIVTTKTGYFSALEISLLREVLQVLDNPLDDIPLFGVLHSLFGGFTDGEIATMRVDAKGESLYESVKRTALQEDALGQKARDFETWLEKYRDYAVYEPISRLLERIIADHHYLEYVTAMPSGMQRRANVLMLMKKATDFEKTSFKGLYHFVRYLDRLDKYEVDYGEASMLDEGANAVRIMTIHKSKGLEFPICFVSAMSHKFNLMDANARIQTDMDLGIATDFVDPVLRTKRRTLQKKIMAAKSAADTRAEELRVLYVALTRAKEKLYMTGYTDDAEKLMGMLAAYKEESVGVLPYLFRSSAKSYLEWVLAAYDSPIRLTIVRPAEEMSREEKQREFILEDFQDFLKKTATVAPSEKMVQHLSERFRFVYPYEALGSLYAKTTVSELKMAHLAEVLEESDTVEAADIFDSEQVKEYLPSFLKGEEKVTGSMRGSATHRFLELLDFLGDLSKEGLAAQKEAFVKEGTLSQEYADILPMQKLLTFVESGAAGRMRKAAAAGLLHREQPFVLGIPANRLGEQYPAEETVLVQGIIDVYFEEEGELVLLDYKTDAVASGQELIDRYALQMDYYQEALERLTGKKVKERILYSVRLGEEVRL